MAKQETQSEEPKKEKRKGRGGRIVLVTVLGAAVLAAILILAQRKYRLADKVLLAGRETSQEAAAYEAGSQSRRNTMPGNVLVPGGVSGDISAESGSESADSADHTDSTVADSADHTDSSVSRNSAASSSSAGSITNSDNTFSVSDSQVSGTTAQAESALSAAADTTPPVISGADPVWIALQADFNVLSGVSAVDDSDPAPTLTADVTQIDTSATGVVTVTYTAEDASGNIAAATRNIHIANEIGEYQGTSFPIYWDTKGISGQPYLVAVNRGCNTVTVYGQDTGGAYTVPVKAMVCSVGADTPDGYYRTEGRSRWKELFEQSWGQYAIRITSHILFHSVPYDAMDPSTLQTKEYNLLGTSASHGCVRLTAGDAKWLYDNCPAGFPAILYVDTDTPGPLGKPTVEQIDTSDARATWDPTDPDEANPWNNAE